MASFVALFLFLHVLSISLWIAAALWVASDLRRTLALGKPHLDALAARIGPALGLDAVATVATFATGTLVMWAEGWGPPRPGVTAGIAFAIARAGLLGAVRRPVRAVIERIRVGEAPSPVDPSVKRVRVLSGIAHALWLLALAGMVFPV